MGDAYRDGRVHVMSEKCSTCVYRPGNLMSLSPGRLKDLAQANLDNDTAFACHQTLEYGEYVVEGNAVCRGYFDAHQGDVTPLRYAVIMGVVEYQDPPTMKKRDVKT